MTHTTTTTEARVDAIDVFRGITIFLMIFVNDLGGVRDIPGWLRHMPDGMDGMTFVDVVFPAFLFIVGMAIPFALARRLERGAAVSSLWLHIAIRTAGLLVLGIFMVNIHSLNSGVVGISRPVWMIILYTAAILFWNQYPKADGTRALVYKALRWTGAGALIVLAVLYRGGPADNPHWLQTSWWGILGLIGWAYFVTCALYLLFRQNIAAHCGMISLFIALYIGNKTGALDGIKAVTDILWLGGHIGGHASITTAGMVVSLLFLDKSPAAAPAARIRWMLLFGAFLAAGGFLLRPLYGICKNAATPSWSLYCAAICCGVFALLYWIIDIKGYRKWAAIVRPAGTNPLLAYILPDIVFALILIFNITILSGWLGEGIPGLVRSAVFALVMVWITGVLTRLHVRLHL